MNEEIVMHLSSAADRWERTHPIIGFGELRVHDALRDAVRCIKETSAKVPRWISVEERLPEAYQHVIVHVQHTAKWVGDTKREERWHVVEEDCWLGDGWECNADDDIHEVTHWMPLPEPPKEK